MIDQKQFERISLALPVLQQAEPQLVREFQRATVLGFCNQRHLSTQGPRIVQRIHNDTVSGMVDKIDLEIQVPATFPEKYRGSLIRSAELCAVKKHLEHPPKFEISTKVA